MGYRVGLGFGEYERNYIAAMLHQGMPPHYNFVLNSRRCGKENIAHNFFARAITHDQVFVARDENKCPVGYLTFDTMYNGAIAFDNKTMVDLYGLMGAMLRVSWLSLVIQPPSQTDMRISSLYVLPEYRKRGIATQLLGAAREEMRRYACEQLSIHHIHSHKRQFLSPEFLGFRMIQTHFRPQLRCVGYDTSEIETHVS